MAAGGDRRVVVAMAKTPLNVMVLVFVKGGSQVGLGRKRKGGGVSGSVYGLLSWSTCRPLCSGTGICKGRERGEQ